MNCSIIRRVIALSHGTIPPHLHRSTLALLMAPRVHIRWKGLVVNALPRLQIGCFIEGFLDRMIGCTGPSYPTLASYQG